MRVAAGGAAMSVRWTPESVLECILALAAEIDGDDARNLWRRRCRLAMRTRRIFRLDSGWQWEFPRFGAERGWDADFRIWRHCARSDPDAARFRGQLERAADPQPLAAFARALIADAKQGSVDPELAETCRQALLWGAAYTRVIDRSSTLPQDEILPRPIHRSLVAVLRALVVLRSEPTHAALVDATCRWIARRLPGAAGVRLLGTLRMLGSESAELALCEIVADSYVADAEIRQLARLHLLARVRQPALLADGGR